MSVRRIFVRIEHCGWRKRVVQVPFFRARGVRGVCLVGFRWGASSAPLGDWED